MMPTHFSFKDTFGQVYKKELFNLSKTNKCESKEQMKYAIEVAQISVKHFREAQKLIDNMFKQSRNHSKNNVTYSTDSMNMNTSYLGELEVNLELSKILIELSTNRESKKAIAKYLRGGLDENKVQRIFTEKIDDWRNFKDFMTDIDTRTVYCLEKIAGLLDSNSWRKMHFNPIEILSKHKKEREKLYFGKMFQNINLYNVHSAKKNLREALRSNIIHRLIR